METGSTTLAFAGNELAATNLPAGFRRNSLSEAPAGIEIALLSTRVEAAYAHAIDCGANKAGAPATKPWPKRWHMSVIWMASWLRLRVQCEIAILRPDFQSHGRNLEAKPGLMCGGR